MEIINPNNINKLCFYKNRDRSIFGFKMLSPKLSVPASQKGFSLLSVLFLTGIVATVFAVMAAYSKESDEIERARASAWHMVQIAKAARLYVRNNSIADPSGLGGPVGDNNGDGIDDATYAYPLVFGDGVSRISPSEIPLTTLIAAGLLPQGLRTTNSLNQDVKVLVANYPLLGDPLDPGTLPSPYVVLIDNRQSDPKLMQYVAEAAKESGLPVSAPTFDGSGAPINDCEGDGQRDAVIWDSGCISLGLMNSLALSATTILPSPFPHAGSLVVPAWRAIPHDSRAVMRYRQTENPNPATLMTNVSFGHEVVDGSGACTREVSAFLPNGAGGYSSTPIGLCATEPDDALAVTQQEQDRRVDVIGTPNLSVNRLILADQTTEDPGTVEVSYTLDASGNSTRNADGDSVANALKNPRLAAGVPEETLGIQGELYVGKALHVGTRGGIAGDTVFFADAAGLNPGLVTVESNLVVSDGDSATAESLTVSNPQNFGTATVLSANSNELRAAVLSQFNSVTVGPVQSTISSLSARNTLLGGDFSAATLTTGILTHQTLSTSTLEANIITGGAVTASSASIQILNTGSLSLGNTTLYTNGPDLKVDVR